MVINPACFKIKEWKRIMDVKEKIERLKIKARLFLSENKKAFIKDIYDNYYFCYIIPNDNPNELEIKNFGGHRFKEGKINETLYWVDILDIQEYKEKEVNNER